MKALAAGAALALLLAFTGCGGGGAAASDSSGRTVSDEITVGALQPQSLDLTIAHRNPWEPAPRATVTMSFSANSAALVYMLIADPDNVVSSAQVTVDSANKTATVDLSLNQVTPVGVYTQPVTVRVCKDAGCTTEFAGSPLTLKKNITVQGTTLSANSLLFSSTAGVAPPSQTVVVNSAPGATFTVDGTYVFPADSSTTLPIQEVFDITAKPGSIVVQPKAYWTGHYSLALIVRTPGYADEHLNITYDVGSALGTTKHLTVLTDSLAATGTVNSAQDVALYVDTVANVPTNNYAMSIEYDPATPYEAPVGWLRFYDWAPATLGTPPTSGMRWRFYANACFMNPCLRPGVYRANIVVTATSLGFSDSYAIPVTFTVN